MNYRPSIWKAVGGKARAREVNSAIAPLVDVMLGNEEDFSAALGIEVSGVGEDLLNLQTGAFRGMINSAVAKYPNFKVMATTLRAATTATRNDWSAICWAAGAYYASR